MIEHGGNLNKLAETAGCLPGELIDFSTNLNPAGIPSGLFQVCFRAFDDIPPYPEPHAESLSRKASEKWNLNPENILFGNGSGELLDLFPRALPISRAMIFTPAYLEYENSCRKAGFQIRRLPMREEENFQANLADCEPYAEPGTLVILGNPVNPAGTVIPAAELHAFCLRHPELIFLIDEAFADFSGETLLNFPLLPNVTILRSMTKYFSIAGLRIGYAVGSAERIAAMRELQVPWSLGTIAARAAEFLLDAELPDETTAPREELKSELAKLGIKVFPSRAIFLLLKTPRPFARALLNEKIAVRDCSNYPGLDAHFIRIAVKKPAENRKLLEALRKLLKPEAPAYLEKRKTPALMIQGTCSNAGKSVLCAAFCRILLQDGFSVAPFKAQNMSLNSYVTPDGGEIGRAQAVQAEACRLDPDVRMNPILLKPDSDLGSQVVLLGHPIGNYKVRDYFAKKKELWNEVKKAYDSLSSNYQCMILEGAGSPGEVNLKSSDLVNMRMAQYAEAKVLLAGDIDRGGVYSSFAGIYATLDPWERELLCGFIVNKFRGDPTLLDDAHEYIFRMTGKPVLGVIDWQKDLGLPEEDSVGFGFTRKVPKQKNLLDIAVIRLGHIANFTDFAPVELEPDTKIRSVSSAAELGSPDMIIIPGSKSVADDIRLLRASGLFDALKATSAYLTGICGGLQILGTSLLDPLGIESREKRTECMDILPLETTMEPEKQVRRTTAHLPGRGEVSGYEIHHGVTRCTGEGIRIMRDDSGRELGYATDKVFATYLHGIFDDDAFRRAFLNMLRRRKGWDDLAVSAEYGIENALNRLADHVRSRIDMKQLYRKAGLK